MFLRKHLYNNVVGALLLIPIISGLFLLYITQLTVFAVPANVITNTSTLTQFGGNDTNTANNAAVVSDYECAEAAMSVTSFTDGLTIADAGQSTSYTLTILNGGPSTVTGLTVDILTRPEFLDVTSMVVTASTGSTSFISAGTEDFYNRDSYSVSGATLLSGQSMTVTFSSLTVLATATDGTNYFTIGRSTIAGPNYDECDADDTSLFNDEANDSTTMRRVADIQTVKTSSGGADSSTSTLGTVYAGSSISYTISITNNGPSEAAGSVVVTDTWPSQVTITSSGENYTNSPGWFCDYIAPTVTCQSSGALANGASSDIILTGIVNQTY